METIRDITGLILAGGEGRRAGRRDKGLIPWQGKPLIAHAVATLAPQVGELLISCNRNFPLYETFAARTVADTRHGFQGPLAGLESAASHVRTRLLVVVCCDMPLLPADLVQRLLAPLAAPGSHAAEITYAHDGVRAQYLCAAMTRETLSSLTGFLDDGHRAVQDWYRGRKSVAVDFSDQAACFRNFNRLV
jgi:molybdopterin-guanine dinucleotide biosynthesis protein A